MGMFDYINCRAPLPDGWQPADRALQTKDFDCDMVCHEITADGRLMLCRVTDTRFEPDPALAHKDGILKYRGAVKRDTEIVETEHHGYVNFYRYYGANATGADEQSWTDLKKFVASTDLPSAQCILWQMHWGCCRWQEHRTSFLER